MGSGELPSMVTERKTKQMAVMWGFLICWWEMREFRSGTMYLFIEVAENVIS